MDQTYTAKVVEILGKTGSRGGITQAKVEITGLNRTLTRNIKGPVQKGDYIILMEAEREARRMR